MALVGAATAGRLTAVCEHRICAVAVGHTLFARNSDFHQESPRVVEEAASAAAIVRVAVQHGLS